MVPVVVLDSSVATSVMVDKHTCVEKPLREKIGYTPRFFLGEQASIATPSCSEQGINEETEMKC